MTRRAGAAEDVDRIVRSLFPVGMRDGIDLTIEFKTGFELFNTRPYHNYETWSQGWYLTAGQHRVSAESLVDALAKLKDALAP